MKKLLCVLLLLLLLTGCGSTVDLMPGASPETSALGLYVYDGTTITRQHLFETEAVRAEVLKDFRNAKAAPAEVDMTALTPPFYGLEIGGEDGFPVYGLWSGGYFFMGDGSVYEFDYDFEALRQQYDFGEPDEFKSLAVMPCASHVAKSQNGWNKAFLNAASPVETPEHVTVELVEQNAEAITVEITNEGTEDWDYGYAYAVQVLLDGAWYDLPAEQEMSFIEILLMIPQGISTTETYALKPYGELPVGIYRVVSNGLTIEFCV